jgi:hypothetical protein
MRDLLRLMKTLTLSAGSGVYLTSITPTWAQAPSHSVTAPTAALKTPWGEPDLQGIWTSEFDTPLQRPATYADQEFFTDAQRAVLDKERSARLADVRPKHGTEADVAGADNSVGISRKRTGARTSLIVDPPNGRIPPLTPEAQKAAAAEREFRLALLQATETCKSQRHSARVGNMIRRLHRDARSFLLATMRLEAVARQGGLYVTIATMGRKTARWRIAA